ncbi:MAG: sensor histidine kinase [Bacteroidetes bacterium]|nr:MAG: sensor histidine kinase [Bacteroidota bacterium]
MTLISTDFSDRSRSFLGWKFNGSGQYLISILLVFFISSVCFIFSGYIGSEVVAFILLLTLSFIAMFLDILPVLAAAVLSALIWDFFFLVPRYNFRVGNTEDKIMLSMYFVIALISGVMTYKIRQIEKIARQKEEKAQTLKLYNTLLNSLSHEFRTPIATIIGATDNLLDDPSKLSATDKNSLLSEISIASMRLNQHVENLLNMSRLESGFIQPKKDWCDVSELIYDVVNRLDSELKTHQVEIEIRKDLPLFKMDQGLMVHVLYNLLNNAVQYTPEKSRIFIQVDSIDEALRMIIEDDGVGFPEDETEKVFEKFYRLQNATKGGTGLGLSIVKGFVEAHKGTVDLSKGDFGGAKFTIRIPTEKIYA